MKQSVILAALLSFCLAGIANADITTELRLVADSDSRLFNLYSAAFTELGRSSHGRAEPDGSFSIRAEPGYGGSDPWVQADFDPNSFNPSVYSEIGGGGDTFPNEEHFTIGNYSVTFDDSGLTNSGTETASINSFQLNFAEDLISFPASWATANGSGTVTLENGVITEVNGSTDVAVTVNVLGSVITYDGTFQSTGTSWDLDIDDTEYISVVASDARYIYDVHGQLSAVPEPASLGILGISSLALFLSKRKRRT